MENIIELDKVNEVYFQVRNLTRSSALEIKEHFSCKIENFWFHPKVRAKIWDGTISFYDWNNQTIPIGLFPQFVKFCKKFGYEYHTTFNRDEIINEISDEEFDNFYENIFKESSFEPRDYQDECIKKALRMKRGIIESPTASGKSLVIYSILRFILGVAEGKLLLIVPNVSLVNQMFSDFQEYGWQHAEDYCSLIFSGSKKINWDRPIIISTWQSIYKKGPDFFNKFQAVIVDETHGAKSNSIQTCLKKCTNAEYRIGVTGTMPEELHNQYTIYGFLGPKIFEMRSKDLIDKGVLSKIKIANLMIEYPKEVTQKYWHTDDGKIKKTPYQEELDTIYGYQERNKVFNYIIDRINPKDNILILCHKISHLKDIKNYLEEHFPNHEIYEIYGKTEAEERERIRKLLDNSKRKIFLTNNTYIIIEKDEKVLLVNKKYKKGLEITMEDDISDNWIKNKKVYKN